MCSNQWARRVYGRESRGGCYHWFVHMMVIITKTKTHHIINFISRSKYCHFTQTNFDFATLSTIWLLFKFKFCKVLNLLQYRLVKDFNRNLEDLKTGFPIKVGLHE